MHTRLIGFLYALAVAVSLLAIGVAALYSQTPAPRVGCRIEPAKITTGTEAIFTIFADQLPPLRAYTLTLSFDQPFALDFQDQDAERDGNNLAPGQAFAAESITQNVINQTGGEIQLAASQPVSSSLSGHFDTLATTKVSGVSDTIVTFHITQAILNDHNGILMPRSAYAVEDCFVEIGNSGSPTPTHTATPTLTPSPDSAFLPIIIKQQPMPTSLLPAPTYTPTPARDVYATDIAEIRATLSAVQTVLASIVTSTP